MLSPVANAPGSPRNTLFLQGRSHPLAVGKPFPTLPLWLTGQFAVPLDLEQSYEQACHDLWIT
jgi:hypothetical protein